MLCTDKPELSKRLLKTDACLNRLISTNMPFIGYEKVATLNRRFFYRGCLSDRFHCNFSYAFYSLPFFFLGEKEKYSSWIISKQEGKKSSWNLNLAGGKLYLVAKNQVNYANVSSWIFFCPAGILDGILPGF